MEYECYNFYESLLGIETTHTSILVSLVALQFLRIPIRDWNYFTPAIIEGVYVLQFLRIPIRDWNVNQLDYIHLQESYNFYESLLGIETHCKKLAASIVPRYNFYESLLGIET